MKRLIFAALGTAVLSGCTGTHIKPPPVCDGKHRRPANLYGSILPSLPVPVPQSQIAAPAQDPGRGQSMVAPPSATGSLPPPPDAGSAKPAPQTSERDIALSYNRC